MAILLVGWHFVEAVLDFDRLRLSGDDHTDTLTSANNLANAPSATDSGQAEQTRPPPR
jgi:hypothetical protein